MGGLSLFRTLGLALALCLTATNARAADPVPAAPAPTTSDVIYPHGSPSAGATAEKNSSGFGPTTALAVVLLAGGGAWLLWRSRRDGGPAGARGDRKLAIAETRSLGNRQYLVVASYEDKKFLLGVCPGRIELLTPLGDADSPKKP